MRGKQTAAMMSRGVMGLLIALGALIFVFHAGPAGAVVAATQEKHLPAVPKKATVHKNSTAHKKATVRKKEAVRKSTRARQAVAKRKEPPLVIVSKTPNDAPDFDFQDRIQQAQDLVAKQPVLPGDMEVDGAGNLTRFVWTLAVGQKTGPLTILRMDHKGNNDQGFTITWAVDNFLNTKFRVAKPDGYIVFAQRRPVRAKSSWEEAVYTAYAPELDTKKMRDAGLDYLRHLERQAYNHLQNHDVRSRAEPDTTVADRIPRSMVLRLMITEHIDPLHMKYVGIEQCIHEVLITIAANREKAYAYSRSSAGALGLPQFIENSYQMVRENYPAARLEPNFDLGMRDLRNAIIATVLHMDLELAHLPAVYLKRFSDSAYHLSAFLAAGYNRNPVNVVRTYKRTKTFTGGDVSFENKMYVRIQDWVGSYLKSKYDIS
jgi:hypothetical protein